MRALSYVWLVCLGFWFGFVTRGLYCDLTLMPGSSGSTGSSERAPPLREEGGGLPFVSAAAGAAAAAAAAARPADGREPMLALTGGDLVFLVSDFNEHCLDTKLSTAASGAKLYPCRNNSNQQFLLHSEAGLIQDVKTKKCLAHTGADSASVSLEPCHLAGVAWDWLPSPHKDDSGQLYDKATKQCLDNRDFLLQLDLNDVRPLRLAPCVAHDQDYYCHQTWRFQAATDEPLPYPVARPRSCGAPTAAPRTQPQRQMHHPVTLATTSWQTLKDAGQAVCISDQSMRLCQALYNMPKVQWQLTPNHQISIVSSNKCIVSGTAAGTSVRIVDCGADPAQQWSFVPSGNDDELR